ncbi:metallophosphoesterase family protein [Mobilitalea sibirica]|uniref:Metallophosphoesterase family protein n=1 Tax=Mobilitalea sibirica TaxID=1462919 RepID=A0A8J7HBR6_9FIRM|nr:metallophosphoesterase [Mobilitalea sibirica]MBH1941396.1 metallophosphoesterase family protein [Mobilitalea sibirica]
MSTSKRLSQVLASSKVLPFDDSSKIVIMSDCHRGDGGWTDNFLANQNLFFAALSYYYERGYTYIELGDGDELWENRKIENIINTHSDAFWLMSQFYRVGRLYMLYGNHDIVKREPRYSRTKCYSFYCDSVNSTIALFPGIEFLEGLILNYINTDYTIFLTHGHQADILNDTFWRLSRFLVRYLWRPLELIGIKDPTSAAKNYEKKNKVEKRLIDWSKKQNQMVITGHTHRPVFPNVGESLYFNDGSCVHPRCITAIEIINGTITLVKWAVMTKSDRSLYVGRDVLESPVRLLNYFEANLGKPGQ